MKKILETMAHYNKEVNEQLFTLLSAQSPEELTAQRSSYFGSILNLLNHIILSDMGWMTAYRDSGFTVLDNRSLDYDDPGFGKELYSDLESLWNQRRVIDDLYIQWIGSLDEEQLASPITLTRKSGKTSTFILGLALQHLFNHQTHHRGAVSQILDEMGVENDYSNFFRYAMVGTSK